MKATSLIFVKIPTWLILISLAILFIKVGGRTFKSLEVTSHYVNEHPECQGAKMNALSHDAHWDWAQTARGDCAFYYDEQSESWIVIILSIVGRGAAAVLILISGYKVLSKKLFMDSPKNKGYK